MTDLNTQAETARAFLSAGNLDRAQEICEQILQKQDDHLGAFDTLFDVYGQKDQPAKRLNLSEWRLERLPNCRDANLNLLIALGETQQKNRAYQHLLALRERLANYPAALVNAELIYSSHFEKPKKMLKTIKAAREQGLIETAYLDDLEKNARGQAGHVFISRKMLEASLRDNPEDFFTLYQSSIINFFTGRIFRAIKQAKQAREVDPKQAIMANEVLYASYISLIPFFFFAYLFVIGNATFVARLPFLLRIPFNYFFFFSTLILWSLMLTGLKQLGVLTDITVPIFMICHFGWLVYIFVGFQKIGPALAKRKKDKKLSKNY